MGLFSSSKSSSTSNYTDNSQNNAPSDGSIALSGGSVYNDLSADVAQAALEANEAVTKAALADGAAGITGGYATIADIIAGDRDLTNQTRETNARLAADLADRVLQADKEKNTDTNAALVTGLAKYGVLALAAVAAVVLGILMLAKPKNA